MKADPARVAPTVTRPSMVRGLLNERAGLRSPCLKSADATTLATNNECPMKPPRTSKTLYKRSPLDVPSPKVDRGWRHTLRPGITSHVTKLVRATQVQSFIGAVIPRTCPRRSLARTATYGSEVCTNMVVSKPSRGNDSTASNWWGLGPASTSQVATSVAPFQLA